VRYAFLADLHSNLEALREVLTDLEDWPGATLVVAGDLVGYGPDPDACIALLASRGARCIAGNHEGMVLGRLDFSRCVPAGIRAARWTARVITPATREVLAGLPARLELGPDIVVSHGDLDDPEHYVASPARADAVLGALAHRFAGARLLVVGHTHHRRLYRPGAPWATPPPDRELRLPPGAPWLLNPGAVGQSRDGQPLARYARYDAGKGTVVFRELRYDWRYTEAKMAAAGLVPRVARWPRSGLAARWEALRARWVDRSPIASGPST
jgi:predicted phosphodiesterase